MSTHTLAVNLSAPVNALAWQEDPLASRPILAAACGDGALHLLSPDLASAAKIQVSESPLLALLSTPEGLITASENGDIHRITDNEATLLTSTKYPFLEHLAYYPKKKQILAATGKKVLVINPDGTSTHLPHSLPSTIGGMALSPIGPRLAVSHYGGASILPLDTPNNPPRLLNWKGSHLALTYSPDGKWLISAMQEQAIHLWRLSDSLDLQMRGYPSKITQFSWDNSGNFLGTNGGGGVPLWDFSTEKGPAGTQARVLADSGAQDILVSAIAMHPKGPFCAMGYSDGLTLLGNIQQDTAILMHRPEESAVTHLGWTASGLYLAAATANGILRLTDFTKLA